MMLDQLCCIDKTQLVGRLGTLKIRDVQRVKAIIREMLVDWCF